MDKLFRRLRRELSRNPKQTAVLAVGLLVAGYFWAPLAAGWLPGGDEKQRAAVAMPAPPAAAASEDVQTSEASRWEELAAWMDNDPLWRRPAKRLDLRNPFRAHYEPRDAASQSPATAATAEATESPKWASAIALPPAWRLDGVFVGRVRTAIIDGDMYRVGDRLPREDGRPEAMVKEIHADYVLVDVGSEIVRLALERPSLAPGDTIAAGPRSGT